MNSERNRYALSGAILTIDLGALRENYRRLKARLQGVACAAVVKADGYGLGAAVVASALREVGCRSFFVAHAVEGVALREALGPEPEIFVLNGIYPGAEDDCARAGLVAVANSAAQLAAWRVAARRSGRTLPVSIWTATGSFQPDRSAAARHAASWAALLATATSPARAQSSSAPG